MSIKKKELALVFGITKNFDFALANVLFGIKEKSKLKNFDIIVFHDGLNEEKKNCLNSILPCVFKDYKNDISTEELNQENLKLYSNMCLARYECFDLLLEYQTVLWNDVDILIQGDLRGLLNYGNKSGLAMTYNDIGFLTEANFDGLIEEFNMCLPLLNSGIIVLTDKLPHYEKMKDWCYSTLKKYSKKLKYLDQGVLNLLVQEFKIEVEAIDIAKYCCHPDRPYSEDACIVHSYGYDKFWNSSLLQTKFPLWKENDCKWANVLTGYRKESTYENPAISVIMSVYERYTFLEDALKSILNQTFQNIEVLIVIEFSSKQKEIEKFIRSFSDGRIRIINNEVKLGFAESLNVGIRLAKGKYIARMDDDDVALPWRLEKQYDYLESHSDIGILGTAVHLFMNREFDMYPETDSEKIKTRTLINNQLFHPTVMMRKELINKYNLFYSKNYKTEDAELWSRAVRFVKISNLPEVLLKYRVCNENETSTAVLAVLESDISIIDKQLKENLSLTLTQKELYLVCGRVSNYGFINNKELLKQKRKACLKIYKANKKCKYYNNEYLAEVLELNNQQSILKRIGKKILRPIYSRLMFRVERLVDEKLDRIGR